MNEKKKIDGKTIINIIIDILLVIFVVLCIFTSINAVNSKKNNGVVWKGNEASLVVKTNSLSGTINKNDIIHINKIDKSLFNELHTPEDVEKVLGWKSIDEEHLNEVSLKDNTFVTFKWKLNNNQEMIITHRYIGATYRNFQLILRFQGTYAEEGKSIKDLAVQEIQSDRFSNDIIGVFNGKRIPNIGGLILFVQSSGGFFVCFVTPLILIFLYQGYRFIVTLLDAKKERKLEIAKESAKLTEEEKQKERDRIRQEILEEMKEKQEK